MSTDASRNLPSSSPTEVLSSEKRGSDLASRSVLLISTLAEYQTEFWAAVALDLRYLGQDVSFLTFDDRSHEYLTAKGLSSYNAFTLGRQAACNLDDDMFGHWLEKYGIGDINRWFSHERITFCIRDSKLLKEKIIRHAAAVETVLAKIFQTGRKVVLVQELGGFLSVVATYFVARHHQIDNYFIEPSFFRGRLFFSRNTYSAPRIQMDGTSVVSAEVREYLATALRTGSIVVPLKDRHQYRSVTQKIINLRNLRRLAEKLYDKHVLGKRQDFGYVWGHVSAHLRMLLNVARLAGNYTSIFEAGRFVYYPLHVPADVALTLRSPEYLDQLALIDYLARCMPYTHRLAIKEHPAMIGAIDGRRLRELLNRHDNLVLLSPKTNNYEVLRAADAIVSVNSKSGAEAVLLGKPVLVLGDAFYRDSPMVRPVNRLEEMSVLLNGLLSMPPPTTRPEFVESYFQRVWDATLPGELYVARKDNVEQFVASLLSAIEFGKRGI